MDELVFPLHQSELRQQLFIEQRRLVCRAERAQHHRPPLLEEPVLCRRQESRPQYGAERAIAEEQAAVTQLLVELPLRLAADVVGEQCVILFNAVAQHLSPRGGRAGTLPC